MSAEDERDIGLHATGVVFGEHGVLILGPSGVGKSALALALLARARATNAFGALVGDDRIWLRRSSGRLIAHGAPLTAGIIERRMAGLLRVNSESAAVVRLVVELSKPGQDPPRFPDDPDVLEIGGVEIPRLALSFGHNAADTVIAVEERLIVLTNCRALRTGISLEHSAAVHKNGKLVAPLRHEGRQRRESVE
jgi:serine kinase of HPr protein (carbohydrate metabolism regulator)